MSIEDKLAIRETAERYAGAVAARDEAVWSDTWAEDATWVILDREVSGRAAIVATWHELMTGFELVMQFPTASSITVDGGHGTGTWSILEVGKANDGTSAVMIGRYSDEYVKSADGKWRFAKRRYEFLNMLKGA